MALHSEHARLSDVENLLDQLITLFSQCQQTQELDTQPRRSQDLVTFIGRHELNSRQPIDPAVKVPSVIVAQTTSPFTIEFCHAIRPQNFQIPHIGRYEGITDPLELLGSSTSG